MSVDAPERVHVAPFGVERERIVRPVVEYNGDRAVLLDYMTESVAARPDREDLAAAFDAEGIDHEVREASVADIFDALGAVGDAILDYADEDVYVNLATGNKPVALGGMIACMTAGARPYYVAADRYGSHRGPVPAEVRSIDAIPSYPMDRPEVQQLRVMEYVATSDRTTREGTPYRIKRELIEFGEREGLPFVGDYEGESGKGKFRRLNIHVLDPLEDQGFVRIEAVGTQRRVFLTEDGRNTLRAFRYLIR